MGKLIKKNIGFYACLIIIGAVLLALSSFISGSAIKDFISGLFVGIAIGVVLIGLIFLIREIFIIIKARKS